MTRPISKNHIVLRAACHWAIDAIQKLPDDCLLSPIRNMHRSFLSLDPYEDRLCDKEILQWATKIYDNVIFLVTRVRPMLPLALAEGQHYQRKLSQMINRVAKRLEKQHAE